MISTRFTAAEWLNSNMHRAYPLHESTAGICPIPPSLIADMFILVVGADDNDCSFYISEVRTTDTSVTISLAGTIDQTDLQSTAIATFPINRDPEASDIAIAGSITLGSYTIHTKIIAGDTSVASSMPTQVYLTEDEGRLFTGCVRGITDLNSGAFIIDGYRVSDPVYLEAGSGVDIKVINYKATLTAEVTSNNQTGTIKAEIKGALSDIEYPSNVQGPNDPTALQLSTISTSLNGDVVATLKDPAGGTANFTGTITVIDNGPTDWGPGGGDINPNNSKLDNPDTAISIEISTPDYEVPDENMVITSDMELLTAAISEYGYPIRSINGVYPTASGELTISGDGETVDGEGGGVTSEGDDEDEIERFFATVAGVNNAAGALKITLDRPIRCDTTAVIERLMSNIAELNKRATLLANMITQLDAASSNLATKVSEMTQ